MKKHITVDEFINSANDPKLIESKARFVIEFLKVGLEQIIKKNAVKDSTVVLTSRDKSEAGDTPAFERREKENNFEDTGKVIKF
jgi:hypothetical protein